MRKWLIALTLTLVVLLLAALVLAYFFPISVTIHLWGVPHPPPPIVIQSA